MQHLLSRACWDADGVRDDMRGYVVEHLGDPDGVLVVDETGDLKKGTATAGVQRQYTGTAGRIENAQVAVYLAYAGAARARADRPGAVPAAVVDRRPGPLRRRGHPRRHGVRDQAGTGAADDRAGRWMPGPPAGWVAGDEVYGADPGLRAGLEKRQMRYVLAVAKTTRSPPRPAPVRADALAARLPPRAWQRLSAGARRQGPPLVRLGLGRSSIPACPGTGSC